MTLEELQEQHKELFEQVKKIGGEEKETEYKEKLSKSEKELKDVKSQLGHTKKEFETLQNSGKSQEELLNQELEKLRLEKETLSKEKRMNELTLKSQELLKKNEIKEEFGTLLKFNGDTTDEELEQNIKALKVTQDNFKANLLKEYSVSQVDTNGNGNKETKSFVDSLIESSNSTNIDLTNLK